MDRLSFFKHGFSAMLDAASSVIGLKHAVDSFTDAVDEALSNIKTDIGLHLPSLDGDMYDQPSGTLYDVAEAGYTMIEVGAYFAGTVHNMRAEDFKELADKANLRITSIHLNHLQEVPIKGTNEEGTNEEGTDKEGANEEGANKEGVVEAGVKTIEAADKASAEVVEADAKSVKVAAEAIEGENADKPQQPTDPNDEWWTRALDTAQKLGCKYVTTSRIPDYPTAEDAAQYADYFNHVADLTAERGMQFCYHPKMEVLRKDEQGHSLFDIFAERCDADKVRFQIDTFEAHEAKIDTVELLKQYPKRVELLHIHDYGTIGESQAIDFDSIIKEGIRTGVKDIYVEVTSFSLPPVNCVQRSIQHLELLPSIRY